MWSTACKIVPNARLSREEKAQRRNRPGDNAIKLGNIAKALLLRTHLFPGCRVLELGSGPGSNLLKLEIAQPSLVVFADICPASIAETVRRIEARQSEPTRLRNYRAEVLDFTQNFAPQVASDNLPYDFALALYSLQYVGRSPAAGVTFFRNCAELLSVNGMVIGISPNPRRLQLAYSGRRPAGNLFSIDVAKDDLDDFLAGKTGVPYVFSVCGKVYHEYTLTRQELAVFASAAGFVVGYSDAISNFLVNYSARYPELARSLAGFMLSSNFDFIEPQQFELFNLYDVHIFYRAGATN